MALSEQDIQFVNSVREPFTQELLSAIQREHTKLGWPIIALCLVEVTTAIMESVIAANPHTKRQFVGHIEAMGTYIGGSGERAH